MLQYTDFKFIPIEIDLNPFLDFDTEFYIIIS